VKPEWENSKPSRLSFDLWSEMEKNDWVITPLKNSWPAISLQSKP